MCKLKKTSVLILSGFLGAGKTTLLKKLLSWEIDLSRTVVIVNEFGDVGIDGMLLEEAGTEVFELSGGCICCALKNNLSATLKQIHSKYHPNRIIIEAAGVADPTEIMAVLKGEAFRSLMEPGRVITVLDADFWEDRDNFGSFFRRQLDSADLILLNKVDGLIPEDIHKILGEVREAFPLAMVLPTVHCNVDQECSRMLDNPKDTDKEGYLTLNEEPVAYQNPSISSPDLTTVEALNQNYAALDMGFVSFSFQEDKPIDETCFSQFISSLPWELFRVKGLVRYRNRTVMVNSAGGKTEWRDWVVTDQTQLTFVGFKINPHEILDKVRECVCV